MAAAHVDVVLCRCVSTKQNLAQRIENLSQRIENLHQRIEKAFLPCPATPGAMMCAAEAGAVDSHGEELATTERITQTVASCPGINKTDLGRQLDLGWGTVDHYVSMLVRQGELQQFRDGRDQILSPPDMDPSDVRCLALLRDELAKRVVSELTRTGEQALSDIARNVGASAPVVRKRLVALAGEGLLRRRRVRGRIAYSIIDGALEHLRNLQHAGTSPGHPGPTLRPGMVAIDEARPEAGGKAPDETRPLAYLRGEP